MDVRPFLDIAIKSAARDYEAGLLRIDEMRDRAKRIGALKARAHRLQRFKRETLPIVSRALDDMSRTRLAVESGANLVAIDVGYREDGPADEIGITWWRAGRVETVNYVAEDRVLDRGDLVCLYGPTVPLPRERMLAVAREAYAGADIPVFHEAGSDLRKLVLVADLRVVDTVRLGRLWYDWRPSLSELCVRYGIGTDHAHNSGNDSRRTMEVLLRLVRDVPPLQRPRRHPRRIRSVACPKIDPEASG